MTAEKLKERLRDSATELMNIVTEIERMKQMFSLSLCEKLQDEFKEFEIMANTLVFTCDLIDAREYARQLLHNLLSIADPNNIVDYHGITIPFHAARLLGFQSYLSMTWAVCDSIIPAISLLLFDQTTSKNQSSPPTLINLIKKKNKTSHFNSVFIINGYGFPIVVSYIIRNHFVHDGASNCGRDFFAGRSRAYEYKISSSDSSGWLFLESQIREKYSTIKKEHTRLTDIWPWHQDNLLKLLELCNDEIDEALSCLVGWFVGMARLQAHYLLERDFSAGSPPPTSL
jgi:hypothetical protein